MAYPQGANFRLTLAFVTDVSPAYRVYPADHGGGGDPNQPSYPTTTAQGNTFGWEGTVATNMTLYRDRSTSPDVRLAGCSLTDNSLTRDFRFDLSASGSWNIRLASGDYSYSRPSKIELFDTSSSLGVLINAATSGGQRFFDATAVERTDAAWPGSNALINKTFATTICRLRCGGAAGGNLTALAHAYVESGAGGGPSPSVGAGVLTGIQTIVGKGVVTSTMIKGT